MAIVTNVQMVINPSINDESLKGTIEKAVDHARLNKSEVNACLACIVIVVTHKISSAISYGVFSHTCENTLPNGQTSVISYNSQNASVFGNGAVAAQFAKKNLKNWQYSDKWEYSYVIVSLSALNPNFKIEYGKKYFKNPEMWKKLTSR